MNLNQAAGLQGMLKEGHKSYDGVHGAVMKNIDAGKAIAGMVRTSLGEWVCYDHLHGLVTRWWCTLLLFFICNLFESEPIWLIQIKRFR